MNLNEGDELIGVDLTSGKDEVMLFSAAGKVVRFKEDAVRARSYRNGRSRYQTGGRRQRRFSDYSARGKGLS